jgi:lipid-A-disaccharide synthase-like uncharacterized protein
MPATSTFLQPWIEPVLGRWLYADSVLWTAVGFLGAAIFGSRFVLQWLQSEKEKKLVVPWYFWHLSFWGSLLNLLYFLHLDKAPLILGNCFLPFLYGRNILFLRAGGEKGRGRFVFAAVAVLVAIGFVVSAFTSGKTYTFTPSLRAASDMQQALVALKLHHVEGKPLPQGDHQAILRVLAEQEFLRSNTDRTSANGDWLDPWGNPYRIFISGKSILIRCAGPNGVFDDGTEEKRDDILREASVE